MHLQFNFYQLIVYVIWNAHVQTHTQTHTHPAFWTSTLGFILSNGITRLQMPQNLLQDQMLAFNGNEREKNSRKKSAHRVNERNKSLILYYRFASVRSVEKLLSVRFYALVDSFLAAFADYLAIRFVAFFFIDISILIFFLRYWCCCCCFRSYRFLASFCMFAIFGNNICFTLIKFGIQNEYFIVSYIRQFFFVRIRFENCILSAYRCLGSGPSPLSPFIVIVDQLKLTFQNIIVKIIPVLCKHELKNLNIFQYHSTNEFLAASILTWLDGFFSAQFNLIDCNNFRV